MALDGEKLRKIRMAKGISQEKLALMCNMNKRTIQRAEKGAPIALETAAFIAEAIQVSPSSLHAAQMELFEPAAKGHVVLIPVASGRRIVDVIRTSFEAEITFDVEPTQDNLNPLAQLAGLLEPFQPKPWESPYERYTPSYSEILEEQAKVNSLLPKLSELGINVFLATYTSSRQIPRYDEDEGRMYITNRTPFEKVRIGLVVVSDSSSSHLTRKPDDIYCTDDEIPF
jgi:transcriptional regulator with XRE-family HTH domain